MTAEKARIVFVDPQNTLRIDKVWLYVSRDAQGNEGVCAAMLPGGMFAPLIAADAERLAGITPIAEAIAARTGKTIHLLEFTTRTELRQIEGKTS